MEKKETNMETRYLKKDILASRTYAGNQDLLEVLLEDGKSYSRAEIATKVENYRKEKVR